MKMLLSPSFFGGSMEMSSFAQTAAQGGGIVSMLLMFGAMFAIMYFVLIRPQQKQQKRHQDLISALKKGDDVVLSSGILGKIFAVEDKFIHLEISDKVKIKVLKNAVSGLVSGTQAEA
jgi:preprotein translocase subunit YajC